MIKNSVPMILLLSLTHVHVTLSMNNQENPHLIIVPGQNNISGISPALAYSLQPTREKIYICNNPSIRTDFGQTYCTNELEQIISDKIDIHQEFILFGTSQGTATSLNFVAKNIRKPKALILKSVMLSGNSAITHTVNNLILPGIGSLPLSYYLLPFFARFIFPFYTPTGEQPLFNLKKIPKDIPIIILHCTNDKQLSFKDAQSLYALLQGCCCDHKNVYLFEMPDSDGQANHFVEFDQATIAKIITILKTHKIIPSIKSDIPLNNVDTLQPEIKQEWLNHFNDLMRKEKNMVFPDICFKGLLTVLLVHCFVTFLI